MRFRFPSHMVATTVAALCLVGGTAPPAYGEPTPMAPQVYTKDTRDGWHLEIKIDNEAVNSVPNLAAAANSREGFVTASGTATATGGSAPITDSIFILGYQLGCQSDVSTGLQVGGTAGVAPLGRSGSGVARRCRRVSAVPRARPDSCRLLCSRV